MPGTLTTPTLFVIYTEQLEACRAFYAQLGLHLVGEQHGRGPVHYAAELGHGLVLELYPATSAEQATGRLRLRLGLAVPAAVAHHVGAKTTLSDPDGRTVADRDRADPLLRHHPPVGAGLGTPHRRR